ncbi:MAG: B12-binding domain-containing radical SAM protein [Rhodospirillaceae bacterium]|nr:B12-binding domain-containing radical SAM protein [Rhodospirillaceae bacterium]MBT4115532.1 B12-binding domain-containing radical SAM protein [Rhodospirillaceae bacterium]MBT4721694.1 B12-binding domain-containing radical SAM protein [Rhodospirillaceae bacterium]MBT4747928.1 B12-binding domain-containing radical SAM protein [Rhodospirillaceae bacterium]MBT5179959.1 B12-binding domain-containing radical SAM protein [Rhodospirillaceae bacterium]
MSRYVPVGIPVGIGFICAYMEKHDIRCRVLDEEVETITADRVREALAGMPKPHVIGIGCLTAHVARAYQIAQMIKAEIPDTIITVGGIHPTALPDEPLDQGVIDYVVRGEGEEIMLQLYRALHGDDESHDIRGVSFRKDGINCHNPDAPLFPDLDQIPAFPYHLFENPKYDMGFLTTSRGCPYRCSFCSQRMMTGTTYRFKSNDAIVDELETLVERYGQREIIFYDDNFCIKARRVIDLCDKIIERGLHTKVELAVQTRADNLVLQGGDEVVKRMSEAGFTHASLGMETGVQRLMDLTLKDETIDIHIEAVALCRRHGLGVSLGMIYGLPTETSQDRKDGFKIIEDLKIKSTKFNNLIPYPGTPLYTDLVNSGRLNIQKDWSNFNSTLALTRSVFDKTPLPYVPETASEWELKRDIIYYNLRAYLSFRTVMSLLNHTRSMGWVALPKRWYLNPAEIVEMAIVGSQVLINVLWAALPFRLTEPVMNWLNPELKKRPRIKAYKPDEHKSSDWDKAATREKTKMLKSAREEYTQTGAISLKAGQKFDAGQSPEHTVGGAQS